MAMGSVEIYALIDPITNEVKYIGKANDSVKRLKSHIRDSRRRNTPVYIWIKSLIKLGVIPKIVVISTVLFSEWESEEKRIIKEYKDKGYDLLNVAIGGNAPFCPHEVRGSNGRKNATDIHSDPKRKKMWYLRKRLAESIKWMEKNNRFEKVKEIRSKLALHNIYI